MIRIKHTTGGSDPSTRTYFAMLDLAEEKGDVHEAQMSWREVQKRLAELGIQISLSTIRNHGRELLSRGWLEKDFALSDVGAREPNIYRFLYYPK